MADWDWVTISALATASGTLVLAAATFASVRSANRAARVAEQAFLMGQRPLVMPSRLDDPPEKLMWGDEHWAHVEGGRGSVELVDGNAYLAMSLRNVGNGTAVLQGWQVRPRQTELMTEPSDLETFRPQLRDLYVPRATSDSGKRRSGMPRIRITAGSASTSRGAPSSWSSSSTATTRVGSVRPGCSPWRRARAITGSAPSFSTGTSIARTRADGRLRLDHRIWWPRHRDRVRVATHKPPAAVLPSEGACAPQGERRDFLPSRDPGGEALNLDGAGNPRSQPVPEGFF